MIPSSPGTIIVATNTEKRNCLKRNSYIAKLNPARLQKNNVVTVASVAVYTLFQAFLQKGTACSSRW